MEVCWYESTILQAADLNPHKHLNTILPKTRSFLFHFQWKFSHWIDFIQLVCTRKAFWPRWSQTENTFSPKRQHSFLNCARKFKLHFPISSSATIGQTNSSAWLAPSGISHNPSVLLSWNQHLSPVFYPSFPTKADWNSGFKITPKGVWSPENPLLPSSLMSK